METRKHMVKKKEVLALILARGGSKGIRRKIIHLFAGYPLISYRIAAGLLAETITCVIQMGDNEELICVI